MKTPKKVMQHRKHETESTIGFDSTNRERNHRSSEFSFKNCSPSSKDKWFFLIQKWIVIKHLVYYHSILHLFYFDFGIFVCTAVYFPFETTFSSLFFYFAWPPSRLYNPYRLLFISLRVWKILPKLFVASSFFYYDFF